MDLRGKTMCWGLCSSLFCLWHQLWDLMWSHRSKVHPFDRKTGTILDLIGMPSNKTFLIEHLVHSEHCQTHGGLNARIDKNGANRVRSFRWLDDRLYLEKETRQRKMNSFHDEQVSQTSTAILARCLRGIQRFSWRGFLGGWHVNNDKFRPSCWAT